jgi:hypothetical protein
VALKGKPEIIIKAIKYIEHVHAIPMLKNNYEWFGYILAALIELACPNSKLSKNNLGFLDYLEDGIQEYRDNSYED